MINDLVIVGSRTMIDTTIVPMTSRMGNAVLCCLIFFKNAISSVFISAKLNKEEANIARQAYASLLWTKQFYHYIVDAWLKGDPSMPSPPSERLQGRNSGYEWSQLFNRDVISMPDKWESPWVGINKFHLTV